jgi:hypothetical protein
MVTAHACRFSATATLACVALATSAAIFAEQDDAATIKRKLVGSWQLISWEENESGTVNYPLGPDAVGQIIYTEDGRMSAQLMRRGVQRFASEDWRKASTEEKSRGWSGYFGYFGTYSIDLQRRAVVHHIEGSWFPNLLGTDQVRQFRFEGERLILDADTQWGQVHIVWAKSHSAHQ